MSTAVIDPKISIVFSLKCEDYFKPGALQVNRTGNKSGDLYETNIFFNLTTKIVKPCLEASKKKKTVEKLLKKLIHRTHKYDRGLKKQMVL